MKKHHFILLGRVGLIYYSWLFTILFIALVTAYEATRWPSWSTIILGGIFIVLFIYTVVSSYWSDKYCKLPYRVKASLEKAPQLLKKWHVFSFYQVNFAQQKYYVLRINK